MLHISLCIFNNHGSANRQQQRQWQHLGRAMKVKSEKSDTCLLHHDQGRLQQCRKTVQLQDHVLCDRAALAISMG